MVIKQKLELATALLSEVEAVEVIVVAEVAVSSLLQLMVRCWNLMLRFFGISGIVSSLPIPSATFL